MNSSADPALTRARRWRRRLSTEQMSADTFSSVELRVISDTVMNRMMLQISDRAMMTRVFMPSSTTRLNPVATGNTSKVTQIIVPAATPAMKPFLLPRGQ